MTKNPAVLSNVLKAISYVGERLDGWTNQFTGVGVFGRDKSLGTRYREDCILSLEEITALYVGDDMAARIVDLIPDEMYGKGFEVTTDKQKVRDDINAAVRRLDGSCHFREGRRFGRCYGGAVLVLGADDGGNADEPLNEQGIRTMRPSYIVDRRWCWPQGWYLDPKNPKYGCAETYMITNWGGGGGVRQVTVHETRLILFKGATTPIDRKLMNNGWDYSILQRLYSPLRQFENNFKSMELLLQDASQAVYGIKNLFDVIAQGKEDVLIKRMQMIDLARSVARALVIDKDNESFERKATSFAGIPESIDKTTLRLAAGSGIPVSILMGQSPAGLNATGDSDLEWFYKGIKNDQEEDKEIIKRFVSLVCLAKDGPTRGAVPDFEIEFPPLRELTAKAQSEIYAANASADGAYIVQGVLAPAEVALSRFGVRGYSQNITIVREPREAMLDPTAINEALNPPEPTDPNADPNQPDPKGQPPKSAGPNDT